MDFFKHRFIKKFVSPLVIAELGLNHNGSLKLAKKSIKSAKLAGADMVKLQSFKTESLCSENSKYYKLFKNCELNEKQLYSLFEFANKEKIILFSTVLDQWSADIISKFKPPFIKIASGDITHIPLIQYVAKKNIPIILSTGASSLNEIREAVKSIKQVNKNLSYYLLHCISNYPTAPEDANISCIKTMKKIFKVPIGFSDHTNFNEPSLIAVALGAEIIEKHFTLDKKLDGPDHALSANPEELYSLINSLKKVNKIKGEKNKKLFEGKNLARMIRRSLFLNKTIRAGEKVNFQDITVSRPAIGIEPKYLNKVIGKKVKRTLVKGSALKWSHFNNI